MKYKIKLHIEDIDRLVVMMDVYYHGLVHTSVLSVMFADTLQDLYKKLFRRSSRTLLGNRPPARIDFTALELMFLYIIMDNNNALFGDIPLTEPGLAKDAQTYAAIDSKVNPVLQKQIEGMRMILNPVTGERYSTRESRFVKEGGAR